MDVGLVGKKTHQEYVNELAKRNPKLQAIEEYVGAKIPILHYCSKHKQHHMVRPQNALKSGLACCRADRYNKLGTTDFIKKSKEKFFKKFDYSKTNYVNVDTKLLIGCPNHGFVEVTPTTHLKNRVNNSGCPVCNQLIAKDQKTIAKYFPETKEKICATCKIRKPESEFTKTKNTSDGLNSSCAECTRKRNNDRKEKLRNEKIKELKAQNKGAQINLSKYANFSKKAWFFPETNEKICSKCETRYSTDNFYRHASTQDGFHSWCIQCCQEGNKKSLRKKYSTFEGRITTFLRTCNDSARKRKQECTLTRSDLLDLWERQNGRCFYSDIELSTLPALDTSVSVERLDSSIGYTPNNTVLVCNVINRMKSDIDLDLFLKMCKAITNKQNL